MNRTDAQRPSGGRRRERRESDRQRRHAEDKRAPLGDLLLAGLRGAGLGVVRLHRHRRHDDRFLGLGLLRVGGDRRRFGLRFGLRHRAGLRAFARGRENALRIDWLSLGAAAASFFAALPWLPQLPVSRPAFLWAAAGAAPPAFSPRAIANISATLGRPPPAGFLRRLAQSAFAAAALGGASAAASSGAASAGGVSRSAALRIRLARGSQHLGHRLLLCQPSTHPCAELDFPVRGNARREKRSHRSRAGAIANRGFANWPVALWQSVTLQQVIGDHRAGRSGDCDFFHNLPITCLFPGDSACQPLCFPFLRSART